MPTRKDTMPKTTTTAADQLAALRANAQRIAHEESDARAEGQRKQQAVPVAVEALRAAYATRDTSRSNAPSVTSRPPATPQTRPR